MSPPTAQVQVARRRAAARRRALRMRRRVLLLLAFIVAVGLGVVLMKPLFNSAVRDLSLPLRHVRAIRAQARAKHLDPALIAAVIYTESKFNDSTSSAGALGLMQLLPATAHFIAQRSGGTRFTTADLATPEVNIAYGSWYLRYLLDEYGGSEVLALAAYNGGETNVNRWLVTARARGHAFGPGDIPFSETRAYVAKVMLAQRGYAATYPHELGIG
jgi:soluble lytic murein transglycosylase